MANIIEVAVPVVEIPQLYQDTSAFGFVVDQLHEVRVDENTAEDILKAHLLSTENHPRTQRVNERYASFFRRMITGCVRELAFEPEQLTVNCIQTRFFKQGRMRRSFIQSIDYVERQLFDELFTAQTDTKKIWAKGEDFTIAV